MVVAEIDVYCSFALLASSSPINMCRPKLLQGKPMIEIRGMSHPSAATLMHTLSKQFIPNDTCLSADESLLLVTGPNMGGKSTLLR